MSETNLARVAYVFSYGRINGVIISREIGLDPAVPRTPKAKHAHSRCTDKCINKW